MNILVASALITFIIVAVSVYTNRRGYQQGRQDAYNEMLDHMERQFNIPEDLKSLRKELKGGK